MFSQFGILDLGTPQLIIILAIVLLLFGGKKLPELSRSLGDAMHELRRGISGDTNEKKDTDKQPNQEKSTT